MNREEFEQLVSCWLDDPKRQDLRARIDDAARASHEFQTLLDQWTNLDRLVKNQTCADVDWTGLKTAINAGIEEQNQNHALDRLVRANTDLPVQLDWPRFKHRVSNAVDEYKAPRVIRRPLRRAAAAAVLAAAAAFVFMITIPSEDRPNSTGTARVCVQSPAAAESGAGVARVAVSAMPGEPETPLNEGGSRALKQAPRVVEVFLMIEPPRRVADAYEGVTPFGVN